MAKKRKKKGGKKSMSSKKKKAIWGASIGGLVLLLAVLSLVLFNPDTGYLVEQSGVGDTAQVESFTLIDAVTDQEISEFNPLVDGATIDLRNLNTRFLNVRANTGGGTITSVVFEFNGDSSFRTENVAPYALFGDENADYYEKDLLSVGEHTIRAVPYPEAKGQGSPGQGKTIKITITESAPDPTPEPDPEPTPDPGVPEPELGFWAKLWQGFIGGFKWFFGLFRF